MTPPIIITVRDLLSPLVQLVDWLQRAGQADRLVIIDNASTWPAMVEWLAENPAAAHVIRSRENLGHTAPWKLATPYMGEPFVVTDPDVVPDEDCPLDLIDHLAWMVNGQPFIKAGVSLRLDDIPERYARREDVRRWEAQFWANPIPEVGYMGAVDTTFALYRPNTPYCTAPALRSMPPYQARHLGWYVDTADPTAEQRYYAEHADPGSSHWTRQML